MLIKERQQAINQNMLNVYLQMDKMKWGGETMNVTQHLVD